MSLKPLCIDLFCGLGGWAEGFLAEGWDVIGFDIERHDYGTGGYPAQLVLQDVLTLHGSQFKTADCIVASPPCQGYSYRAMPWKRAKALPPPSNELFDACFRIASEAGVPIVVENVQGAQKWVGRAKWHYGSFYLWGDVPALMPFTVNGTKSPGMDWSKFGKEGYKPQGFNVVNAQRFREGLKVPGFRFDGKGSFQSASVATKCKSWFNDAGAGGLNATARFGSKSDSRKAASAQIAKIPFPLASHIARCLKPQVLECAGVSS